MSNIKIVDHYKIRNWIELKNSFKIPHEGWNHTAQLRFKLLKEKVNVDVSNEMGLSNGEYTFLQPGISLKST